jgi:hypothetical protein
MVPKATLGRYFCKHFAMHLGYIVLFLPPAYFVHPISHAFCDLASAETVIPTKRSAPKTIVSILDIALSPGFAPNKNGQR